MTQRQAQQMIREAVRARDAEWLANLKPALLFDDPRLARRISRPEHLHGLRLARLLAKGNAAEPRTRP